MSGFVDDPEPVHGYFGLTYANYLVLHRSLMQSMSVEWQRRMVACLTELDDAYRHLDDDMPYSWLVKGRDVDGRFITDPVPHYNRGRTYVAPSAEAKSGALCP